MKRLLLSLLISFLCLTTIAVPKTDAATFRTGDTVMVTEPNLSDLYIFGSNIRVDTPITNDVVAGGGDIAISQNVSNSIIAGGGTITLTGTVGNTVRVAGGNITLNAAVERDVIAAGGSVTINQDASIGGDVVWSGGNLTLNGPVEGNVVINGGNATINSPVSGNVSGTIGKLIIGPNARINGNLSYSSEEKAQIADGATISGTTSYTPIERPKQQDYTKELITAGAVYKLITDIIISVLLITFFARALQFVLNRIIAKPAESGAIGFTFIFFAPIAAFLLLILLWLGVGSFITYALVLLLSTYITKIFTGWWLLTWWEKRDKRQYKLDWKAGVFGPIILFLLGLIPFIGWIPAALLFFVTTGAFIVEVINLMRGQKQLAHEKAPAKKTK